MENRENANTHGQFYHENLYSATRIYGVLQFTFECVRSFLIFTNRCWQINICNYTKKSIMIIEVLAIIISWWEKNDSWITWGK